MNAGIITLKDGTLCIMYDQKLPYPIDHVEFCRDDFSVTLVYKLPDEKAPKQGAKFDYPLDPPFAKLLEKNPKVAVSFVKDKQAVDIKIYSVVFTDAP